jgi:hypothetical protein
VAQEEEEGGGDRNRDEDMGRGEDDEARVDEAGTSASARPPYKRGPSRLPRRPIAFENRPFIGPSGDT